MYGQQHDYESQAKSASYEALNAEELDKQEFYEAVDYKEFLAQQTNAPIPPISLDVSRIHDETYIRDFANSLNAWADSLANQARQQAVNFDWLDNSWDNVEF